MKNEKYQECVRLYNDIDNYTEEEQLEKAQLNFIQKAKETFDSHYFGLAKIGENLFVIIESIWEEDGKILLHVDCEEFEGDLIFVSLKAEAQKNVVNEIFKEIKRKVEGPKIYGTMVNNHNINYRQVRINELNTDVMVTTEETFKNIIKEEGSEADNKFYCYVPTKEFYELDDKTFENYVNDNFN